MKEGLGFGVSGEEDLGIVEDCVYGLRSVE